MIQPGSAAMTALSDDLDALDWRREAEALAQTVRVLSAVDRVREALRAESDHLRHHGLGERMLLCRETPTHWKWFLGGSTASILLWLHEYKPSTQRRPGYADSVHDHRYSFVSAIVCGGYIHRRFTVDDGVARLSREEVVEAGSVYALDADEVHGVAGLQDGTLTLIAQAPKRRPFSTEFFTDGRPPQRHHDFDERARGVTFG
jgi:hypothetical protein